jgi:hypothetical protein
MRRGQKKGKKAGDGARTRIEKETKGKRTSCSWVVMRVFLSPARNRISSVTTTPSSDKKRQNSMQSDAYIISNASKKEKTRSGSI